MKRILATLSIIPSLLVAIVIWVIGLPRLLWLIPKDIYYFILSNKVLAKVTKNDNGTYTISYHGKTKTYTEEEFAERFGKK